LILRPAASREEEGGLEPHPESYSELAVINRSRHLAASSSMAIRARRAKFSLLLLARHPLLSSISGYQPFRG